MTRITDIYGQDRAVDESKRKLQSYDNAKKEICYCAPILNESGQEYGQWTEYKASGTVTDIEERLLQWNNPVIALYAKIMEYNAKENDPDGVVKAAIVDYVENHLDEFFYKNGNWKQKIGINAKKEIALMRNTNREKDN